MNEIIVSISCITYNHEKYIAEALDGFLMQNTNFKIEILVHDDASTDRTVEIIESYRLKYPDIIKPIYQTENQYSKGIKVSQFNFMRAIGKYIALCEGDDFWTDANKLQKQVDFMESNSEYSVSVHGANITHALTQKEIGKVRPNKFDRDYSFEEVVLGGGGLFATNTMLFRTESTLILPSFYYNCAIGDYPLMIFLASIGRVYYMEKCMSSYRICVQNSWTSKISQASQRIRAEHIDNIEIMLNEVDRYTSYKYFECISSKKIKNRFELLVAEKRFKEIKEGVYVEHYNKIALKTKLTIFILEYLPIVADIRIAIRKCIK